jgi:hypothetical protein
LIIVLADLKADQSAVAGYTDRLAILTQHPVDLIARRRIRPGLRAGCGGRCSREPQMVFVAALCVEQQTCDECANTSISCTYGISRDANPVGRLMKRRFRCD